MNVLLEHTEYDYCIDLVSRSDLPKNHIYSLTIRERQVLKKYINGIKHSGKIWRSCSPIRALILSCRSLMEPFSYVVITES